MEVKFDKFYICWRYFVNEHVQKLQKWRTIWKIMFGNGLTCLKTNIKWDIFLKNTVLLDKIILVVFWNDDAKCLVVNRLLDSFLHFCRGKHKRASWYEITHMGCRAFLLRCIHGPRAFLKNSCYGFCQGHGWDTELRRSKLSLGWYTRVCIVISTVKMVQIKIPAMTTGKCFRR